MHKSALRVVSSSSWPRRMLQRLGLEKEDLLAIPLCIFWGMGLILWTLGANGSYLGLQATGASGGNSLALWRSLVSLPVALVRQLLG